MAVSGGCTSSYTYILRDGVLDIVGSGARLRSECLTVDAAVAKLLVGERATVAGVDAFALRLAITGKDEHGAAVQP